MKSSSILFIFFIPIAFVFIISIIIYLYHLYGNKRDEKTKETLKTNDQRKLIKIAKRNSNQFYREKAVKKISDESVLADIAKNDSDSGVHGAAVGKISDESVLIDIAKNDSNSQVREKAVRNRNLKDKSILEYIAKYDPYYEKTDSYTQNTGKIIGYSDHDGDEYEWERVDVYEYPVRKAANDRLYGAYNDYCIRKESSII